MKPHSFSFSGINFGKMFKLPIFQNRKLRVKDVVCNLFRVTVCKQQGQNSNQVYDPGPEKFPLPTGSLSLLM